MKNLKWLALFFMAGAVMFSSCGGDEEVEILTPTINFVGGSLYTSADATMEPGDEFKVGVTAAKGVDSKKKLVKFKVVRTFNNDATTVVDSTIDVENFNWSATYNANVAEGAEKWEFTVIDAENMTASVSFNITTEATVNTTPLGAYSADVYLSNQSWATYNGNATTSLNATIGLKMTGSNVGVNNIAVDGATGLVEISSVATITDYEALQAAYDGGSPVTSVSLPVDDLGKAFSEKFFAVKTSTTYYLVDYKAGVRSTANGNVVVLAYKTAQ